MVADETDVDREQLAAITAPRSSAPLAAPQALEGNPKLGTQAPLWNDDREPTSQSSPRTSCMVSPCSIKRADGDELGRVLQGPTSANGVSKISAPMALRRRPEISNTVVGAMPSFAGSPWGVSEGSRPPPGAPPRFWLEHVQHSSRQSSVRVPQNNAKEVTGPM